MMEVVVTTGAIRRVNLQSNHHYQQTNIQFLQPGCPSCRPTNNVRALKEKVFPIFDFKNAVTLKTVLGVRQGHWKCHRAIERI